MKVAVLSDSHDNIWNLERVLPAIRGVGLLIHCGDLCAPFSLDMIAAGFSGPIHVTLGNNDGDPLLLSKIAAKYAHVSLSVPFGVVEADGRRLAFVHYPEFGEGLAAVGRYDAVFVGHSHRGEVRMVGQTLLANPGEVMGRLGTPTFGLYDTQTGEFAPQSIG